MGIPEESLQRLMVLRREIDRIFRDFFDPDRPEAVEDGGQIDLLLDLYEDDEAIVIEVDLPGVPKEQIELSVLRDIIIVEGRKGRRPSESDRRHLCMERTFGSFRRIVEIPGAGDTRNIQAEYDRGVLRIRLPKIKDRRGQRRRVPID
jgi:HSP20 family protein